MSEAKSANPKEKQSQLEGMQSELPLSRREQAKAQATMRKVHQSQLGARGGERQRNELQTKLDQATRKPIPA